MLRFRFTLLVVLLAGCATLKPYRREDPDTPTLPPQIVLEVAVDQRAVEHLLNAIRCNPQQASFADPENPGRQIQFRYHLISTDGDQAEVDFTGPDGTQRRITVTRGGFTDTGMTVDGRRILVQIR